MDGEQLTPLDYAVIGQHQEVATLLIEHGALSISLVRDLAAICIQKVCYMYHIAGNCRGERFCDFSTNKDSFVEQYYFSENFHRQ